MYEVTFKGEIAGKREIVDERNKQAYLKKNVLVLLELTNWKMLTTL